jgi:hypothetical protein
MTDLITSHMRTDCLRVVIAAPYRTEHKAISSTSAMDDFPEPLQPEMTVRPGPGCSGTVSAVPIPRTPAPEPT